MSEFLFTPMEGADKDARARVNKPLSIFGHKEIKARKGANLLVGNKTPQRKSAVHTVLFLTQ